MTIETKESRKAPEALPLVRAEGVRKSFGDNEVLKGIDLHVQSGEVVCLIGASGSGKSTFLRCVNHLEKIDGGLLWVGTGPWATGSRGQAP
ncbi:aliphatic sulfonates import ATP-binding protein SsuB [Arthrobacter sp. Hiyo8]|nr:aliphatic sulfonates import ATP-binding protein SsuB [Arthrobacter sp. Hiyo8]